MRLLSDNFHPTLRIARVPSSVVNQVADDEAQKSFRVARKLSALRCDVNPLIGQSVSKCWYLFVHGIIIKDKNLTRMMPEPNSPTLLWQDQ